MKQSSSFSSFLRLVALRLALVAALFIPSRADAAAHAPVAVEVLAGAPEIDPAALRDAVSRELDAPVLEGAGAPGAAFTIVVSVDRPRSELVVERRDSVGGMSRRVPLPADVHETLRAAVFLIGNLARDEASELVDQMHPARPAAPAPAAVAPPPPPPDEAAAPAPRDDPARFWVGVDFTYDLIAMPNASDVCLTGSSGYSCTDANGNALSGSPLANVSDRVAGGITPANTRALVSIDYAASGNVLLGLRAGFVFNTYSGHAVSAFPPVHLEARATYVFGDAPLAHAGFAPYVMAAAGVAQSSAQVSVTTEQNADAPGAAVRATNAEAWQVGGPGFVSAGAGVRWAMTPRLALLFGPRINVAFGGTSTLVSAAPELGLQYGF